MSESTEPKLLPCAHCSGEAVMKPTSWNNKPYYFVYCTGCFSESGIFTSEAEARAAWNRRPAPQWTAKPKEEGDHWVIVGESRCRSIVWVHRENGRFIVDQKGYPQSMVLDDYIEMFHVTGFCKIALPALPEKGGNDE